MVEKISTKDYETQQLLSNANEALKALATHLKKSEGVIFITVEDQHDFLDSLGDQVVTATGVAYCQDYGFTGAMDEINDSNWSKFVDGQPVYDENKKVIKGPNYRKADLTAFL